MSLSGLKRLLLGQSWPWPGFAPGLGPCYETLCCAAGSPLPTRRPNRLVLGSHTGNTQLLWSYLPSSIRSASQFNICHPGFSSFQEKKFLANRENLFDPPRAYSDLAQQPAEILFGESVRRFAQASCEFFHDAHGDLRVSFNRGFEVPEWHH